MKKKKNDISFGHRHEWTDTHGFAHKVVFDESALEKPRATWITLTIVATMALAIGGFFVATYEPAHNERPYRGAADAVPKYAFARDVSTGAESARALTPGWRDEFFVADDRGVTLYNVAGEILERWGCFDGAESPTSLEFVSQEESVANGVLFIGFANKIYAMHFSLEEYVATEVEKEKSGKERGKVEEVEVENASRRRTAARGALTSPELVLNVPDANIRGMTSSGEKLFVADYATQRIMRYSLQKILTNRGETKIIAPDCELGEPNDAVGYPGLKPAFERNFRIAYSRDLHAVYAANSGLYRIDAFDASTGAWNADASWGRQPGIQHSFVGAANPIAFDLASEWIVTAEVGRFDDAERDAGKTTPIQFYTKNGEWVAESALGAELSSEVSALDVEFVNDAQAFCVLKSDGRIEIFESR